MTCPKPQNPMDQNLINIIIIAAKLNMLNFAKRHFTGNLDYAERLRLTLLGRRVTKQTKLPTDDESPRKLT